MTHHYKTFLLALLTLVGGVKSADAKKVEGSGNYSYTTATATVDGDNFVLTQTTSADVKLTYVCAKSDIDEGEYIYLNAISYDGDGINSLAIPEGVKCSYNGATYEFKVQNYGSSFQSPFNGKSIKNLTISFAKNAMTPRYYNGCGLESIFFTSSELSEIGHDAFAENTTLKSVLFNASSSAHLTTIGENAFYDCSALSCISWRGTSQMTEGLVELPDVTTEIGKNAFYQCKNIKELSFAQSYSGTPTRKIGQYAFWKCTGLVKVDFSGNAVMDFGAFISCSYLSDLYYNTQLICGEQSFSGCYELKNFYKKDTADDNQAGEFAFMNCNKLPGDFVSTFSRISRGAFESTGITSVTLNSNLRDLGKEAFKDCGSLSEVTLNEGLQTIGDDAFNGTALSSITLPSTLTSIGNGAFRTQKGLGSITSSASAAPSLGVTDPSSKNFFCNFSEGKSILDARLYFDDGKTYTGYDKMPWTLFERSEDDILQLYEQSYYFNNKNYGTLAAGKVSYRRNNLTKGQYATFCLPFDISLAQVSDVFDKVFCASGHAFYYADGTLLFFVTEADMPTGTIKAGTPFIAKVGTAYDMVAFLNSAEQTINKGFFDNNPEATTLKVYNYDGTSVLQENKDITVKFGGTYLPTYQTSPASYMTFNTDGTFGAGDVTYVKAFRAYLQQESATTQQQISRVVLDLGGDATGIADIKAAADAAKAQAVYTLDGRTARADGTLNGLPAGIYIKGGRKVVVK